MSVSPWTAAAVAVYPSRDFPEGPPSRYMLFDEVPRMGGLDMAVEVAPARRRFTRAEYHRMAKVGILAHGERLELICGEIVKKLTQGRRHALSSTI